MTGACLAPPDGIVLRPLEPGDAAAVLEVFAGLSPRSRELRFLTAKPRLTSTDLQQLTAVDHHDHVAVLAVVEPEERLIGVARFVRESADPESADVAVAVVDDWQSRGIGTRLVTDLIERARELGVRRFTMTMSVGNEPAHRLLHRSTGEIEQLGIDAHTVDYALDLGGDEAGELPPIGTLLGVWAHPDDEAYLSSGLMAQVRASGGRVVVATATRGEHGTDDPVRWPPAVLSAERERELAASLAEVGVDEHRWLGYRDGVLGDVPVVRGADDVARLLEELRPDVIVTFGPDGMTGHADHRAVSAWTTEAWRRTGQRARLWYATLTPEFHREWGELNEQVGLWTGTPPVTPAAEVAASVRLTGALLDRKHRALRAHASQTRSLEELVGSALYRQWWSTETFVAA